MSNFIEHSDDWSYQPPVPSIVFRGWWVVNDDGEPCSGPFSTKEDAEEWKSELED